MLLALAAAVAALGALELAPAALARPCALLAFFAGAGLPVVARLAPTTGGGPALEKLLLFGVLLSPVLATALFLALHVALASDVAAASTFGAVAVLPLVARGRRARVARPGAALAGALVLSVLLAALTAAFLLRGSAPRVSYHGLLHASLLFAVDRGVPPENPWLAGSQVAYYWFWHGMGALLARGAQLAPTRALAWLNVWAALTLPLSLYLAAAPLWRGWGKGAVALAGTLLGLLGLNLLGGWQWLAAGAPWSAPHTSLELLDTFQPAVGSWGPRLAWDLSKLGNLSSHPAALALVAGGLAAAAHALRHGARPWPALCGMLLGAALAVNPVLGSAALGCTAAAALLAAPDGRVRGRVLLPLALGALPGAALVHLAGRQVTERLVHVQLDSVPLLPTLAPVLPLLVPALAAPFVSRRASGVAAGADRRALLGLLLATALLPLALHPFVRLPEDNQYKLVRLAVLPLGVLAAGGLAGAWARGGALRTAAGLWAGACAVGIAALGTLGLRSYLAFASVELPIEERPHALLPVAHEPGPGADARALYAWLRSDVLVRTERPVLLLNATEMGPVYGDSGGSGATQAVFTGARNLQGHEAPAFSGLELWCDRRSYLVEHDPRWERRLAGVVQLYGDERRWDDGYRRELDGLGRPVLLVVTDRDRAGNRGLDQKVRLYGYAPVREWPTLSVYAAPPDFAAALAGEAGR